MFTLIVFISLFSIKSLFAQTGNVSIGDFVWSDTNSNGLQDAGEPGIANVTVKLYDSVGTVLATTTTNSNGIYNFTISVTGSKTFKISFGTPGQYTFTLENAPGSTVTNNSNADVNGFTPFFKLSAGQSNPCIDAGIIRSTSGTACVGDFVFVDQNANGKQDSGEPGVANVTVKLINGVGTAVATTTTNSNGYYLLTNVPLSSCGQYKVQFGTPGQYTWTIKEAPGTTATNNSNADANGFTSAFTLCPGDYFTCIDAGIVPSGGPLPILLSRFQGNYSEGVAKLGWTTNLETPQTNYDIERSTDGTTFKFLSTVNSKGISTGSTYTFNDNLPANDKNYYRLKIYEAAGFQYSYIIVLNVELKGVRVKLLTANPFINQVKLNVAAENATTIRIIVADHLGRVIKTQTVQGQKGSNEISINDVSNLTKGIYNVEVIAAGQSKSIKLLKN